MEDEAHPSPSKSISIKTDYSPELQVVWSNECVVQLTNIHQPDEANSGRRMTKTMTAVMDKWQHSGFLFHMCQHWIPFVQVELQYSNMPLHLLVWQRVLLNVPGSDL